MIDAYIDGAENALRSGKSLARGAFKLGIANQMLGSVFFEWTPEEFQARLDRIGILLEEYEALLG